MKVNDFHMAEKTEKQRETDKDRDRKSEIKREVFSWC